MPSPSLSSPSPRRFRITHHLRITLIHAHHCLSSLLTAWSPPPSPPAASIAVTAVSAVAAVPAVAAAAAVTVFAAAVTVFAATVTVFAAAVTRGRQSTLIACPGVYAWSSYTVLPKPSCDHIQVHLLKSHSVP
ncbi:hypothetical protein GGX14DRAFT_580148 [Mycena pura]|uniref:Uncharacterized protein n=1 Tax=Mycena pura TaxID=153505 RepID=A0AAD6UQJ2_9AGAR|nr:hypothetical protein GGX14DRAFT_580148 [Mycena pura]